MIYISEKNICNQYSSFVDSVFANSKSILETTKSILTMLSWSLADMCKAAKYWVAWRTCSPLRSKRSGSLNSCFSFHSISKCSFAFYLVPHFFFISALLLMIFLFKIAPKCSAEVLSSVLKCEKAVKHLKGNICVLENHSGISCVVDYEFNVQGRMTYFKYY